MREAEQERVSWWWMGMGGGRENAHCLCGGVVGCLPVFGCVRGSCASSGAFLACLDVWLAFISLRLSDASDAR